MSDMFEVDAPAPFRKFEGAWKQHSANQQAVEMHAKHGDIRKILSRKQLREYEKMHVEVHKRLSDLGIWELVGKRDELKGEWETLKAQRYKALRRLEAGEDAARIKSELAIIAENARSIRDDARALNEKLAPYRVYIQRARRLEARIAEHHAGVKDEIVNRRNRQLMHKEANTIAEAIIRTMNNLDICFRTTRKGKERVMSITFSRVVVTPDTVQLKIKTGSRGLFGRFIQHIPRGVDLIGELKKESRLQQISATIEMDVTCPMVETGEWWRGTWLHVQRNGLRGGIPERVSYSDFIQRYPERERHLIPIPGGLRPGRWVEFVKLAKTPHLIVTGQTGSGKSNYINSIISTLITTQSPRDVQLVLIDLKEGIEAHEFRDVPHVAAVLEDIPSVARAMVNLESIRKERMQEFKRAGVRNILDFNTNNPDYQMPHVVVFFDEFAATNSALAQEHKPIIWSMVEQLAQKARAAGIHLVIGIQTPRKETVPRGLFDNITWKAHGHQGHLGGALAAAGGGDVLEMLSIAGRFLIQDGLKTEQAQMAEITDTDIAHAIRRAHEHERVPLIDVLRQVKQETDDEPLVVRKAFNSDTFISIVLNDLHGTINYRAVHEIAQDDYSCTRAEAKRIAYEIKAKDEIIYGEKRYRIVNTGKGQGAARIEELTDPLPDSQAEKVYQNGDLVGN